jgi:hypothetical protein
MKSQGTIAIVGWEFKWFIFGQPGICSQPRQDYEWNIMVNIIRRISLESRFKKSESSIFWRHFS